MKTRQQAGADTAQHDAEPSSANRLRIIGGRWRNTRLNFPAVSAIRPTPDRVRETLFNWLQNDVIGARCLDLFAGSGALGLEALSRGAQSVVFVDQEPQIARYLRDTLARLQCSSADVFSMDAQTYLRDTTQQFDLLFLDPPFALTTSADWLTGLFARLQARNCLSATAWIYLECPASLGSPVSWDHWPTRWRLHRSKQTGQVGYHLARHNPSDASR